MRPKLVSLAVWVSSRSALPSAAEGVSCRLFMSYRETAVFVSKRKAGAVYLGFILSNGYFSNGKVAVELKRILQRVVGQLYAVAVGIAESFACAAVAT